MSQRSQVEVGPSRPLLLRWKPEREALPSTCALAAILVLEMARIAVMAQRRRVSQTKAEITRSNNCLASIIYHHTMMMLARI